MDNAEDIKRPNDMPMPLLNRLVGHDLKANDWVGNQNLIKASQKANTNTLSGKEDDYHMARCVLRMQHLTK